jgi:hypothetical protein
MVEVEGDVEEEVEVEGDVEEEVEVEAEVCARHALSTWKDEDEAILNFFSERDSF